jgi:hypothetical protein
MSALVDEGPGAPAGRFAIVSDRSAIDRAEQLARQTQRLEMVGALAGEVALQINDPLTFVRSSLVEIERLGALVDAERGGADGELAESSPTCAASRSRRSRASSGSAASSTACARSRSATGSARTRST